MISTLLTCLAIVAHWMLPPNSIFTSIISIFAAIMATGAASSGMLVVDKAPKQTVVMERPVKIIPPHRDAFKRTSYSIYYLSARICRNTIQMHASFGDSTAGGHAKNFDWLFACICVSYAVQYFVPRAQDVDLKNGNTYIFMVPMALGLSCDALFQVPTLQCRDEICWNSDVVAQIDLLCVLLSGLVVAFIFTLAFHGLLGIRKCYWCSAFVVHGIVVCLIAKVLPYLRYLLSQR